MTKGVFTFKDGVTVTYEQYPFTGKFSVNSVMIMTSKQLKAFLKKMIERRI
jgi:hypothetical protein